MPMLNIEVHKSVYGQRSQNQVVGETGSGWNRFEGMEKLTNGNRFGSGWDPVRA